MSPAEPTAPDQAVPEAAAELDALFSNEGGGRNDLERTLDLSEFLHARGVNMRYLPAVAAQCRSPRARRLVECEVAVRAAKHKIRALWAQSARSERHSGALAERVVRRLRRGELWDQLPAGAAAAAGAALAAEAMMAAATGAAPSPSAWRWEARLRAALGLDAAPAESPDVPQAAAAATASPKTKVLRAPAFVPLEQQERVLLRQLEFRRASGGDAAPVELQLVALYSLWSAGDDPRESFAKGAALVSELLARHRRGPLIEGAVYAAARWHKDRAELDRALPLVEELLCDARSRLGADHLKWARRLATSGMCTRCVQWPRKHARLTAARRPRASTRRRWRHTRRRCASSARRWAPTTRQ
jgi:hypothetical protein